jgi:hypothetical protein
LKVLIFPFGSQAFFERLEKARDIQGGIVKLNREKRDGVKEEYLPKFCKS